tara:strand:- start:15570 stop:15896 length:327 start_codon:yes stop_codon:yes gene_type:complete
MTIYHLLLGLFILYLVVRKIQKRAYHHPANEGLQTWKRIATGLLTIAFYAYMCVVLPPFFNRFTRSESESLPNEDSTTAVDAPSGENPPPRTISDFLLPPLPSWSDKH